MISRSPGYPPPRTGALVVAREGLGIARTCIHQAIVAVRATSLNQTVTWKRNSSRLFAGRWLWARTMLLDQLDGELEHL